jgi:predicted DNA-binding transcriptional regulator AlpA
MDEPRTIGQFCAMVEISRYTYYRMRRRGETPRETRVTARRTVILPESLREWFIRRDAEAQKKAEPKPKPVRKRKSKQKKGPDGSPE